MAEKVILDLYDSSLTPKDDTPTNVQRLFNPGAMEGNVHAFYNDHTGETSLAESKITASYSRSTASRPTNRIKVQIALPLVQTIDGVEQVHHVNRANVEFILHESSTFDERYDLNSLIIAALAHTGIKEMYLDNENAW